MPPLRSKRWRHGVCLAIAAATAALASDARHAASACGPDTDCVIGDRTYRIAVPENRRGTDRIGALIYVHGYRGKSAGVMKQAALTGAAADLGLAFVAAQAAGPEWNISGVPSADAREGVDELAYFDALVDDVAGRFAIDPAKLVVAGFSSGAMMVWTLACYRGATFAGFVPMSGTFWQPLPESCPTASVNLIHYHGDEDPVVPLHGRPIKDGHQGDVYEAVELFIRAGAYRPAESEALPDLRCSRYVNDGARRLELCLFAGKHTLKAKHIVRAWRAFEPAMRRTR